MIMIIEITIYEYFNCINISITCCCYIRMSSKVKWKVKEKSQNAKRLSEKHHSFRYRLKCFIVQIESIFNNFKAEQYLYESKSN